MFGSLEKRKRKKELRKRAGHLSERSACGLHCIKMSDISVYAGKTPIIEHVNVHIHCGKLTAIIGRNGAGKSTLIKAILGEVSHEGTIEFRDMKENKVKKLRIGYVPQHLNIEKDAPVSVYDLFASCISNVPVFLCRSRALYDKILNRLALFEAENLIDKRLGDLSGGELQRVLLSIACTPVPNLLLLDEPISGVDRKGMELFYRTIHSLKEKYDLSVILVSHDLALVKEYADSVILLDKSVLCEGTPEEVMESKEFHEIFG
ncbi:MAG: metal ABC transporter ATP-binding protein [Lachnospiraceae bacterium]|nr:metal ABC transporter ATP-binding protein [Lachnospiraceae bacterium]